MHADACPLHPDVTIAWLRLSFRKKPRDQPETSERWNRVGRELAERGLDAFLVTFGPNVRYLTGFTGSNAAVLIIPGHVVFFTDPRYGIQAEAECPCAVRVAKGPLYRLALRYAAARGAGLLGFESEHLSHDSAGRLARLAPRGLRLEPVAGLIEALRRVKTDEEVGRIEQAAKTCAQAFLETVRDLRPGLRESEVAAELDYRMRRLGASGPAFETIVAAGGHSALPHARPGADRLKAKQLVLVDCGAMQNGYCSDMTRMLYLGRPGRRVDRLYSALRDAQQAALERIREGVTAESVDRAARRVLKVHSLEESFVHSTGHGLGLEIHEAPRIGRGEKTRLQAGMVVTVEPGIYIEGFGGMRLEDLVVVTPNGHRNLTPLPRDLITV